MTICFSSGSAIPDRISKLIPHSLIIIPWLRNSLVEELPPHLRVLRVSFGGATKPQKAREKANTRKAETADYKTTRGPHVLEPTENVSRVTTPQAPTLASDQVPATPPISEEDPPQRECPADGCTWKTQAHGGQWQYYYHHLAYRHGEAISSVWWEKEGRFLCRRMRSTLRSQQKDGAREPMQRARRAITSTLATLGMPRRSHLRCSGHGRGTGNIPMPQELSSAEVKKADCTIKVLGCFHRRRK